MGAMPAFGPELIDDQETDAMVYYLEVVRKHR